MVIPWALACTSGPPRGLLGLPVEWPARPVARYGRMLQGCEIALHAKTLRIPVVMISGSIESIKFAEDNGLQLLCKPFRILQLIQAVEDAIASGQFGQRDA
jgi:hypothetical protein